MDEAKLKEAFLKIKEEIKGLVYEISDMRSEMHETSHLLRLIEQDIVKLKLDNMLKESEKPSRNTPIQHPDIPTNNPTHEHQNTLNPTIPTHNPTVPQEIEGWNTQNFNTSTGNEGVPTDRQTNRQTVQQTDKYPEIPHLVTTNPISFPLNTSNVVTKDLSISVIDSGRDSKPINQQITEASEILESLDNIKKDIRKKFKSITKQEMLVFSTIYALEEQDPDLDYKKVAFRLGLSESSIRDYVQRIVKKGIPIEKEKLNNKKILLHISPQLKQIATLDTIIRLRSL